MVKLPDGALGPCRRAFPFGLRFGALRDDRLRLVHRRLVFDDRLGPSTSGCRSRSNARAPRPPTKPTISFRSSTGPSTRCATIQSIVRIWCPKTYSIPKPKGAPSPSIAPSLMARLRATLTPPARPCERTSEPTVNACAPFCRSGKLEAHRYRGMASAGHECNRGARAAGGEPLSRPPRTHEDRNASLAERRAWGGRETRPKGSGSGFGVVVFGRSVLLEDSLGDEACILPNGALDPVGHLRTRFQEDFGVLPPLAEPHAVERKPGA